MIICKTCRRSLSRRASCWKNSSKETLVRMIGHEEQTAVELQKHKAAFELTIKEKISQL